MTFEEIGNNLNFNRNQREGMNSLWMAIKNSKKFYSFPEDMQQRITSMWIEIINQNPQFEDPIVFTPEDIDGSESKLLAWENQYRREVDN